jgi:hypothetical protein
MSADKGGPRDWDKELAEIDKIIAGTPPAKQTASGAASGPGGGAVAGAGGAGSGGAAPTRPSAGAQVGRVSRKESLATWFRVGLGVALAAGMTQWPYFHACGTSLFLYLGAVGVLGVSGIWGALSSWRRRMGLAHLLSLIVVAWGGVLAAATILPRIGYAKRAAEWWCP